MNEWMDGWKDGWTGVPIAIIIVMYRRGICIRARLPFSL